MQEIINVIPSPKMFVQSIFMPHTSLLSIMDLIQNSLWFEAQLIFFLLSIPHSCTAILRIVNSRLPYVQTKQEHSFIFVHVIDVARGQGQHVSNCVIGSAVIL